MEDTYFVILYCQNGKPTVLMDEEGEELAIFGNKEAAKEAAWNNPLGFNFGYEIHEVGAGEQE